MLRSVSLVVLLSAGGLEARALAQSGAGETDGHSNGDADSLDREARSLFEAGSTAYDDGRFEAALRYFRRAFELSDRPQLLYNIAQAADRLRRDEEALEALRAYRKRVPDARNRAQVDSRIATLEAQLQRQSESEPAERPEEQPETEATAELDVKPEPAAPPPSPLETDLQAAAAPSPGAHEDDEGGLLSQWWFWAAATAVVAGTVVGVTLASAGDDTIAEPEPGTDGLVVVTLRRP